jgi:hypothetical protein
MSETIAVKIPAELKRKVKQLKDKVDWPEEIRLFIKRRIKEIEAEENMNRICEEIRRTGSVPKGFSKSSVREDRESS